MERVSQMYQHTMVDHLKFPEKGYFDFITATIFRFFRSFVSFLQIILIKRRWFQIADFQDCQVAFCRTPPFEL